MTSRSGLAVLAFGGNALLPDPFHPEQQESRADDLARAVMLLLGRCPGVVLVHGNGPQVGMILLRVEGMAARLPAETLDVMVAETQGSIGYLLSRALGNALLAQGSAVDVTSILTQVVVEADDPAFRSPSKPIGPHYDADEAQIAQRERGWHMVEEQGKGWRRVVPSPRPVRVVELDAIAAAARVGHVVIAGGGGGVPVRAEPGTGLIGVEAVVDKDRTACLLARSLEAETFVVLTGVPHVSEDFGTPQQRRLAEITVARARELLAQGVFPRGSMAPKIESVCDYVAATGRPALITDCAHLGPALEGDEGTVVLP